MIPIVQFTIWRLGPYTVRQCVRLDNAAFAQYIIFRGERLIGKSFSVPDLGCCQWLQHQRADEICYAAESAKLKRYVPRSIEKARAFSLTARKDGAG